jgi:archaellum component FlaC
MKFSSVYKLKCLYNVIRNRFSKMSVRTRGLEMMLANLKKPLKRLDQECKTLAVQTQCNTVSTCSYLSNKKLYNCI